MVTLILHLHNIYVSLARRSKSCLSDLCRQQRLNPVIDTRLYKFNGESLFFTQYYVTADSITLIHCLPSEQRLLDQMKSLGMFDWRPFVHKVQEYNHKTSTISSSHQALLKVSTVVDVIGRCSAIVNYYSSVEISCHKLRQQNIKRSTQLVPDAAKSLSTNLEELQIFYYFQSGVSLQNSLDLMYSQFDGIFIAAKVSKSILFILFLHCRQANPGNGHSIKRRQLDLERCF